MPNSLVWIGLVVVWIFVLFPMVAGRRSPVLRTGRATLATRVLHRGGVRTTVRRGAADGHPVDPEWESSQYMRHATARADVDVRSAGMRAEPDMAEPDKAGAYMEGAECDTDVAGARPAARATERGYVREAIDAEIVEDEDCDAPGSDASSPDAADAPDSDAPVSGAGDDVRGSSGERAPGDPGGQADDESDEGAGRGGLRAEEPGGDRPVEEQESRVAVDEHEDPADAVELLEQEYRPGRGGFDPKADAAASAARYRVRQRAVLSMGGGVVVAAVLALKFSSLFWWVALACGVAVALYLTYLRRQVRMEQEIRRRRMARLQRSRKDSAAAQRSRVTAPAAPRGESIVVLEADDEDPAFDHLDGYAGSAYDPAPDGTAYTEPLRYASGL